jgi:hypothetical protein
LNARVINRDAHACHILIRLSTMLLLLPLTLSEVLVPLLEFRLTAAIGRNHRPG